MITLLKFDSIKIVSTIIFSVLVKGRRELMSMQSYGACGRWMLSQLSPVDNWRVWRFLLTMVTSKNSEK